MGKEERKDTEYRTVPSRQRGGRRQIDVNIAKQSFNLTLTNRFDVFKDLDSNECDFNPLDNNDTVFTTKTCIVQDFNTCENKKIDFTARISAVHSDKTVTAKTTKVFSENFIPKACAVIPGKALQDILAKDSNIDGDKVYNNSFTVNGNKDNVFRPEKNSKSSGKTCKSDFKHKGTKSKKKESLTCFYSNADSLLNKRTELLVELEIHNPDIIAICEVKPKSCRYTVQPGELSIQGYELFHNLDSNGRGVLLLIKNELSPSLCDELNDSEFQESIFVNCILSEDKIVTVGIVYRSPNSSQENSTRLNTLISKCSTKNRDIMIVGDFNYPEISWELETCRTRPEHEAAKFLKTCKDSYLSQLQSEPTRYRDGQEPSLLDLVLTNREEMIIDIETCAGLGKSDHCSLVIKIGYSIKERVNEPRPNFRKADFDSINKDITSINWNQIMKDLNINEAWLAFRDNIDSIVSRHVPMKKPATSKSKAWMSKELLEVIRKKHNSFRKSKKHRNKENLKEKNKTRNKANRECRKARRNLEKKVAEQSKNNPKPFWSYATSKLKTRTGISDLVKSDGSKTNSDLDKAEVLNSFFQSVFTVEPDGELPDPPEYNFDNELNDFEITIEETMKLLKGLHTGKASGPDGINPLFLANTAESIALPVFIIFSKSLSEGKIPNEWRQANVSPIFKKGNRSAPNNYRPVSLTCILCKLMEKIVRKKIIEHLENNNLISSKQHGFVTGRSCVTQLLDVLDIWTKTLDEGGTVDAIYMDFQKAFDSVPHRRLIAKVKAHGIEGNTLNWITDFLQDRSQKVIINGISSSVKTVTSGIPQGSVLGPILFVMYINDLPSCVQSSIRLFADDTKVFTRSDIQGATEMLQKDLDHLQNWSEQWLLRFHPEKCHVLKLGHVKSDANYYMKKKDSQGDYKNIPLDESEHEKDLGVFIDNKLNFKEHVHRTTSRANRIMGVIRRTFDYLTEETFVQLFKSLVRPILEYGNSAWQPCSKNLCQEIEDVQRRSTKLIASLKNLSYPQRLAKLKLPSLEHRRKRGDLIEMYKYIHGKYICENPVFQINQDKRTRGHSLRIDKGHHRLNLRGNYFTVRAITSWNDLPEEVVTAPSVNAFKSQLDNFWKGLKTIYDPECYHTD